jgi:hypothetical protein
MIGITFLWLVYPLLDSGSLPCHVYVLSHMYCFFWPTPYICFLHSLDDLSPRWSFCSFATLAWLASSLGANLLVSQYYYERVSYIYASSLHICSGKIWCMFLNHFMGCIFGGLIWLQLLTYNIVTKCPNRKLINLGSLIPIIEHQGGTLQLAIYFYF